MNAGLRWLAAVATTLIMFVVCLWIFRFASFSWLPHAEADRWVVDAGFATVVATSVGAGVSWWAGKERSPSGNERAPHSPPAGPNAESGGSHYEISGGTFHGPVIQARTVTGSFPDSRQPPSTSEPAAQADAGTDTQ